MTETIDQPIIVVTDHATDDGSNYVLTAPSAQLITLARSLTTGPIYAIALNPAPALQDLGALGVDKVLIPDLEGMSPRVPGVVSDAVTACLLAWPAAAVFLVSNYRGREVSARLSVQLNSGAAVDVSEVRVEEGHLVAEKSILAASWETVFHMTRGTPVIAVRPSSVVATAADIATEPDIIPVKVEYSAATRSIKVKSSVPQVKQKRKSLTEASIIVTGGRGTDGDFTLVEELADILGASVGATRVAVDEGWVDRALQVGQTGVSVAPELYITLGVSGAIHHTCAIQAAQKIVAVCDDSDAPIFNMCDFGVVGDINQVIPQAIAALKAQSSN